MSTSALDRLLPDAQLREIHHVDVTAPPERTWEVVRHGEMPQTAITRALFALRTLPERIAGGQVATLGGLDELISTPTRGPQAVPQGQGGCATIGSKRGEEAPRRYRG